MELSVEIGDESSRGAATEIDLLRLTLESYVRLPISTDLRISGDNVILATTGFPELLQEATGLSFHQYFHDVWSSVSALAQNERERLIEEFTNIFATVKTMISKSSGAVLERTEKTTIKLPALLSRGIVESITLDEQLKFRLDANPPYQAAFADISGINFRCLGFDLSLQHLALRAEDASCHIIPSLTPQALLESAGLLEKFKHKILSGLMKLNYLELKVPVVMDEFKEYLASALNLKTALREHKEDLLSLLDQLSEIKIEDPFARAVFKHANRYRRVNDRIEIYRDRTTLTDCGGVTLSLAPELKLTLCKRADKLQIDNIDGIAVRFPFEPPKQLETFGISLAKTIPTAVTSFAVNVLNSSARGQVVVGIGVNRWISFLIDEMLQPLWDNKGHWTLAGVASNPISENRQSFYIRLNRRFEIDMSVTEMMNLVTSTALEGFEPMNPLTWHWGVVAAGGGSLSTIGSMLGLSERTFSNIAESASSIKARAAETGARAAKESASAVKKGASAIVSGAEKVGKSAGAAAAKAAGSAAASGAKAAGSAAANGAKAAGSAAAKLAADLFKKKKS